MKKISLALVFCSLLFASLLAQAASLRTTFTIPYETGWFSSSPNEATLQRVMSTARMQLWKAFLEKQDTSMLRLVEQYRGEIETRLADLVTEVRILDQQVDKDAKQLRFTIRGVVNENLASTILTSAGEGVPATGQGSLFGFLVLPRIQFEAKSYDTKTVKKTSDSAKSITEKVNVDDLNESGSAISERSIAGDKSSLSTKSSTSGNATRASQQAKWKLGNARDVDANITKYLSEAGYEPAAYADIANECGSVNTKLVREDMLASETAELSDEIRREVFKALRECDVRFFAVGTLDFDSIEKDANSGGTRARAVINIQIYDISKRIPRKVASAGPVDYYGVGPQEDGALTDALKTSSKKAALTVVNQMRAKGLK